jgi:hypothetical protein
MVSAWGRPRADQSPSRQNPSCDSGVGGVYIGVQAAVAMSEPFESAYQFAYDRFSGDVFRFALA